MAVAKKPSIYSLRDKGEANSAESLPGTEINAISGQTRANHWGIPQDSRPGCLPGYPLGYLQDTPQDTPRVPNQASVGGLDPDPSQVQASGLRSSSLHSLRLPLSFALREAWKRRRRSWSSLFHLVAGGPWLPGGPWDPFGGFPSGIVGGIP